MTILDYQPKQARRIPRRIVFPAIAAVLLLCWLCFAECAVDDIRVCQDCGLRLKVRTWYGFQSLTTQQKLPSPVYDVLAAHGFHDAGPHRWVLCGATRHSFLGGHCCECVFGDPIAVSQNAMYTAGLFENLYAYADPATADLWRRRFLNRSTAAIAQNAFDPTDTFDKFPTKKAFDDWWSKAGPALDAHFTAASK